MGNLSDRISGTIKRVPAKISGSVDLKHEGEAQVLAGRDDKAAAAEGSLDQIAEDDLGLYEHHSHGSALMPAEDVVNAEQAAGLARAHHPQDFTGHRDKMDGIETAVPAAIDKNRPLVGKF